MKLIKFFLILFIINIPNCFANIDEDFSKWKLRFKKEALANNIGCLFQ